MNDAATPHPVWSAAEKGDLLRLMELMDAEHAQSPTVLHEGTTPLWIACKMGHHPIVEYLLARHGADPNGADDARDCYVLPLRAAAMGGHSAVLRLLHAHGAELDADLGSAQHGCTAMWAAAFHGHHQGVLCLLELGADPNIACSPAGTSLVTPLWVAAQEGHLDIVATLHKHIASSSHSASAADCVRADGASALYVAAQEGHVAVVQYLAEAGANLMHTHNGETALYVACEFGRIEVLRYLIQMLADDQLVRSMEMVADNGFTPRGIAISNHHTAATSLLDDAKKLKEVPAATPFLLPSDVIAVALSFLEFDSTREVLAFAASADAKDMAPFCAAIAQIDRLWENGEVILSADWLDRLQGDETDSISAVDEYAACTAPSTVWFGETIRLYKIDADNMEDHHAMVKLASHRLDHCAHALKATEIALCPPRTFGTIHRDVPALRGCQFVDYAIGTISTNLKQLALVDVDLTMEQLVLMRMRLPLLHTVSFVRCSFPTVDVNAVANREIKNHRASIETLQLIDCPSRCDRIGGGLALLTNPNDLRSVQIDHKEYFASIRQLLNRCHKLQHVSLHMRGLSHSDLMSFVREAPFQHSMHQLELHNWPPVDTSLLTNVAEIFMNLSILSLPCGVDANAFCDTTYEFPHVRMLDLGGGGELSCPTNPTFFSSTFPKLRHLVMTITDDWGQLIANTSGLCSIHASTVSKLSNTDVQQILSSHRASLETLAIPCQNAITLAAFPPATLAEVRGVLKCLDLTSCYSLSVVDVGQIRSSLRGEEGQQGGGTRVDFH